MEFFSMERVIHNAPIIMKYLPVTFGIVLTACFFGLILALILATSQIYNIPVLKQISKVYVSFIVGTPILVQMFIVYYGLPMILWDFFGIDINTWDKMIFVLITYSLNQAGFLTEIFRTSILSIPVGQMEAAYSVGLTKFQTFRRIILPQAFRVAIPSFSVNLAGLFQDTSLAFMLGIVDIMGKARMLQMQTKHIIESYFIIACIFVAISIAIKLIFGSMEKKLQYGNK